MIANTDHRETVFRAAQQLANEIYGISPAAEALAEKIMHRVIDGCSLLECRALLERARKTWLGHPDREFIAKIDGHLGLGENKAKPEVLCYSDGISCPGCPHYHDPVKNPDCSYKNDAPRATIDDASNDEWLHAAARIAGGNHVEDPDDESSDTDTMGGPARGEKESALCAAWLAYQTELISEREAIRQSVALATAADLEISAMRKQIVRACNSHEALLAFAKTFALWDSKGIIKTLAPYEGNEGGLRELARAALQSANLEAAQ